MHPARIRFLAAATATSLLAGCAHEGAPLPQPLRAAGVAVVAVASVLGPAPREGAPAVRPLGPVAAREETLTWLGHSSFLIRTGGASLLTDPMQAAQLFPGLPLGPYRISPPVDLAPIRRLDAVLVSHADRDHLDLPTLRALAQRFPSALLILPEGDADLAAGAGFRRLATLAPWRAVRIGSVTVTAVPSVHYGRRDVIGLVPRLALGYAIEGGDRRLYFSGDTAYGPVFRDIRRRLGRFDTALVPIGAYAPPAFFGDVHTTPEEAAAIARDLGARRAIGHHWGTFGMGPDVPAEARRRFSEASGSGLAAQTIDIGETVPLGRSHRR